MTNAKDFENSTPTTGHGSASHRSKLPISPISPRTLMPTLPAASPTIVPRTTPVSHPVPTIELFQPAPTIASPTLPLPMNLAPTTPAKSYQTALPATIVISSSSPSSSSPSPSTSNTPSLQTTTLPPTPSSAVPNPCPIIQESYKNKKPEDQWITSGRAGSRDAVLVFRADILNLRFKRRPSKDRAKTAGKKSSTSMSSLNVLKRSLNKRGIIYDILRSAHSIRNKERNAMKLPIIQNKVTLPPPRTESTRKPIHIRRKNGFRQTPPPPASETEATTDGELESENEECLEDCVYKPDMPALELKITYKFTQTETRLLRRIFIKHGLTEAEDDNSFNILWTGMHMRPDILRSLTPYQRVNHFPRSYELTRKDRLYKNIARMQHLHGARHFDVVPKSYMVPSEYKELMTEHNKYRGHWIVKPAASSRGRGIFIVNTPEQIPLDEAVIVSKYISNPLLIDGHKCDVRLYVLVTSFDPLLIYVYEEGLVRLATVKYNRNADNLWNPCMHLCNYSINKYHTDYITSDDAQDEDVGHKWTFSALLRHLRMRGCNTGQLMSNIEDLIIKSLFSSAQTIISACRMFMQSGSNCFELYGFDILIDDELKPWLLEINLAPSMNVDSPLDAKVKSCLMVDVLTCVGIPAYSPAMRAHIDNTWTRFRGMNIVRHVKPDESLMGTPITMKDRRTGGDKIALTAEEVRFVREARLQDARRGGLVRIFPTEDTWQKYSNFLDATTGVPLSTPSVQTQASFNMTVPHNYNRILFDNLYGGDSNYMPKKTRNGHRTRMMQYERTLEVDKPITFLPRQVEPKCSEKGKFFRKRVLSLIDEGTELTQLQVRQTFAAYLHAVLQRLTVEPKDYHEKLLLRFLTRVGSVPTAPDPQISRSKARSALVAKALQDYLDQYIKISETYLDVMDHFGMVPMRLFKKFLNHAQEADLEAVLVQLTKVTNTMPYLYNRCGIGIPLPPPIATGAYGLLKSLPNMALHGAGIRDTRCVNGRFTEVDIAGYKSTIVRPRPFLR